MHIHNICLMVIYFCFYFSPNKKEKILLLYQAITHPDIRKDLVEEDWANPPSKS